MTISFCPRCNKRYLISEHIGDYVHECSQTDASAAIKNEDVIVVGNWEDFSGSGTRAPQEVLNAGKENQFEGTKVGLLGYKKQKLTDRGVGASTHRQRKHSEYINLDKKELF